MIIKAVMAAAAVAVVSAIPAAASSEAAWAEMRADIQKQCLAQRDKVGSAGKTTIDVNPFGSERFGAAILTTKLKIGGTERIVCIYDKVAHTVELTGPFAE